MLICGVEVLRTPAYSSPVPAAGQVVLWMMVVGLLGHLSLMAVTADHGASRIQHVAAFAAVVGLDGGSHFRCQLADAQKSRPSERNDCPVSASLRERISGTMPVPLGLLEFFVTVLPRDWTSGETTPVASLSARARLALVQVFRE